MTTILREEIESQHKKAVKAWDGEKRAAIKKAKALKGKKGKDALEQVEQEYAIKLQDLEAKYSQELEKLVETETPPDLIGTITTTATGSDTATNAPLPSEANEENSSLTEKERKLEKARRKKEKQKQKELEMERELEEIAANAGPNMRIVEMEQIQSILSPLQFTIVEVPADGNCLYRAIAAQTQQDYQRVRALCADTLQSHQDDFAPFCELDDDISTFDDYVQRVRDSAEWGGHLELRALGMALDRPIHIFKAGTEEPLHIHEQGSGEPIRLSYHHHYYALGEHYNQVVPCMEVPQE